MLILAISNGMKTVIMIAAMIAVFYFFLIRPQNEQRKKEEAYRDSLQKGDRVMTAGGIHGTIAGTEGYFVQLEVAPGTRIKVAKASIQPIPERKK
ncbi:MAG: preprotein translocase subunit YajC [Bacteroidales bacterium]|nr:preprotein translocase subunit YajC [Bacteroidales bacterium]